MRSTSRPKKKLKETIIFTNHNIVIDKDNNPLSHFQTAKEQVQLRAPVYTQTFFKVFKNSYLRKSIFSYLPLFVLTPESVNKLGSCVYETLDDIQNIHHASRLPLSTLKRAISLTQNRRLQTGTMWSKKPISVVNGFIATFSFQIIRELGVHSGDGLAFVIQCSPSGQNTFLPSDGSSMGYAGLPNSIAIEFDTYQSIGGDPNDNHVSIQTRGKKSNHYRHEYSIGWGTPSTRLDNGGIYECVITYDVKSSTSPVISVTLNGEKLLKEIQYDIANIGLYDGRDAFVGFSAATGVDYQFHRILNCEIFRY